MEYKIKRMITQKNYGEYVKDEIKKEISKAPESYIKCKEKYPDAVLLFRTDDIYEMYCEDAQFCSRVLGIGLKWVCGVRLASFWHYDLDAYLPKIIKEGKRVAICEKL